MVSNLSNVNINKDVINGTIREISPHTKNGKTIYSIVINRDGDSTVPETYYIGEKPECNVGDSIYFNTITTYNKNKKPFVFVNEITSLVPKEEIDADADSQHVNSVDDGSEQKSKNSLDDITANETNSPDKTTKKVNPSAATTNAFKSIDDLYTLNVGTKVTFISLVRVLNRKDTTSSSQRESSPYVTMELADSTNSIDAKKWDTSLEMIPDVKAGVIVHVEGTVSIWSKDDKPKRQIIVDTILPATNDEILDINRFVPTAPIEGLAMYHQILDFIATFENKPLKKLLQVIFVEYKEKALVYPAAKIVHHAFVSGWLMHTYQMLRSMIAISNIYFNGFQNTTFEFDVKPLHKCEGLFDPEIAYAYVLIHDIGKWREIVVNQYGIGSDLSLEGSLLGHISIGQQMIAEAAAEVPDIDKSLVTLLQHAIVSHHGTKEFGSPIPPTTLEAEILHHLDMLDSRINIILPILKNAEKDAFSERSQYLNNRSFYRHT